jgi:hypothetical protein
VGRWGSEGEGSWRGTELDRAPSEGCKEPLVAELNALKTVEITLMENVTKLSENHAATSCELAFS